MWCTEHSHMLDSQCLFKERKGTKAPATLRVRIIPKCVCTCHAEYRVLEIHTMSFLHVSAQLLGQEYETTVCKCSWSNIVTQVSSSSCCGYLRPSFLLFSQLASLETQCSRGLNIQACSHFYKKKLGFFPNLRFFFLINPLLPSSWSKKFQNMSNLPGNWKATLVNKIQYKCKTCIFLPFNSVYFLNSKSRVAS